ncbi:hypothetical protein UA08_08253 [Talaromyces atroroseus]|uniref:Uncharacterized protein n=1 Tax=Talaromyces atroroseus TaxID=1441469 RepID=A0A225AQH1_TALAT|nr:hypothetical protein UA08_08253 [Talaromyces atroroseus]OKL56675.1 hypothetical protein UA08_08253 [Talaromyces atroroseus]
MRTTFASAAFIATANALVARDTPTCCFGLAATGNATGVLGQIDDGQVRIGSGLPPGQFCIDPSGAIKDGNGRGCYLTPPTSQLQCDVGANPMPGFTIDSSGKIHHNASTSFVACQSGQSDQMNIYTSPAPSDVTGCEPIELQTDKCQPPGGPPAPPGPPAPAPPSVPPTGPAPPAKPAGPPAPPPSGPSPAPAPAPAPAPPGHTVGPGGPSPSGPAPPAVPSSPAGPSSCPTPGPQGPGPAGSGQAGPTTSGAPNAPSGHRTPSAPHGSPTAPGLPPFANSSAPAPAGNGTGPTAPIPTGAISPTGGVTPAPGAGGGGCGGGGSSGGCPGGGGGGAGAGGGGQAGCGTTLVNGSYEFPHLIIPIDSSSPSKAPGTSYNGTITSSISSIFNFDFGQNVTNKQCSLVFLFPTQDQLETSAFSFKGDGAIKFSQLEAPASNQTSSSNAPDVKVDYGVTNVSPGHSYTITNFACPVGETLAFELKNAGSTDLNYFEDFNPAPIGLYITTC